MCVYKVFGSYDSYDKTDNIKGISYNIDKYNDLLYI